MALYEIRQSCMIVDPGLGRLEPRLDSSGQFLFPKLYNKYEILKIQLTSTL